jgi:RNA-binding protein YlmH
MKPFTVYLHVKRSNTLDKVIEVALKVAAVEKVGKVEFIFGHQRMIVKKHSTEKSIYHQFRKLNK